MTIINITASVTGLSNVKPSIIYVETNDTIATVSTPGYLNGSLSEGYPISDKNMALVSTKLTPSATISSTNLYSVSVTAGVITLTETGGGSVSFPITVPEGGTGDTTLSPYALMTGGTTSTGPVQQVASLGTIGQLLKSNGPGALPTWVTAGAIVTPSALTETNDTNVTLTLGGTPATSLLQAVSITAGWTGTLAVPRGGLGVGTLTPYSVITGGTTSTGAVQQVASLGTSGQVLTSAGAGALPTWTTISSGGGTVGSGTINQLAWYAATGSTVSGLTIVNSAGLLTSSSGVPGWVAYTGTGAPVLQTSPSLITPNIGAAVATSLDFSPVTNGIIGITGGQTRSAGFLGEIISSQVLQSAAVTIPGDTNTNLTSVNLTAGDWDLFGNVSFIAGAITIVTGLVGISLVSDTLPDLSLYCQVSANDKDNLGVVAPSYQLNITSPTTIYLVAAVDTGVGEPSVTMCGYLYARRAA